MGVISSFGVRNTTYSSSPNSPVVLAVVLRRFDLFLQILTNLARVGDVSPTGLESFAPVKQPTSLRVGITYGGLARPSQTIRLSLVHPSRERG